MSDLIEFALHNKSKKFLRNLVAALEEELEEAVIALADYKWKEKNKIENMKRPKPTPKPTPEED